MRSSFSSLAAVATVAYVAVSVEAGGSPFRGRDIDGKWRAPRETQAVATAPGELAYMAQIDLEPSPVFNDAPATTAPATLTDRFWERDTRDNTCAYISGNSTDSLYCATTAGCVVNTDISIVGCCADTSTSCNIYTTCLPMTSSDSFTTNNGLTLYCNDATYSECVTHFYVDSIYSGYTLLGCGKTEAVDDVYYQPTSDSTSSPTSASSRKTTSTTSTTSDDTKTTATTSSRTSTTDDATTTTTAASPTTNVSKGSKSNTGPIVGGVVGGIAGLALIGAGIFFLLRRNENKANGAVPPAGAAGAPGAPGVPPSQPPMAQNGYYNGVPGGEVAGAGAGVAAGAAGAVAYHQYGQPGQQQNAPLYDPYVSQVQQQPPQQQYDPARVSMYTTAASPLGSPQPTQSPHGTTFGTPQPYAGTPESAAVSAQLGTPQPYAGTPDSAAISAQHTGSPQPPIAPYTAPAPAPGMGFHSGPVPSNLAELPTERGHGNVQELA
ncbi:hypothetical protein F503_07524 [Ophiostoma piceae UAMH 11346]|uniref:Uncharacterized protein n=1 Tax=Ophiostoma piceae (strain UAMH 11346) TaxID=1262450 RepID=S3CSX9_OPHP1|nr:hypothetical protein F503_07524 [Ophiostoma piceae UAMH 11346]